jgi:hypothetical protein
MFRLIRYGCTSLSVASILTRPFTILYIKTSLALCLLSSNVGHFNSSSMLVTDESVVVPVHCIPCRPTLDHFDTVFVLFKVWIPGSACICQCWCNQ